MSKRYGGKRMTVEEVLWGLRKMAEADPAFREKLLKTRSESNAVGAFCKAAEEAGFTLYEMDLVMAGEEYYAAMRRSTNGGGENSPLLSGSDDYYEMFMAELEAMKKNATI